MSPPGPPADRRGGFIALFARHPTAMNLLMAIMLIGGASHIDKVLPFAWEER